LSGADVDVDGEVHDGSDAAWDQGRAQLIPEQQAAYELLSTQQRATLRPLRPGPKESIMAAPRALPAPSEPVVVLCTALVDEAKRVSRESERRRVILPFHKGPEDNLHRMFNAMQPGTYAQPHRHLTVPKSEVFLLLSGALDFLVFDDEGGIELAVRLAARTDQFGIDLPPGKYHGIVVREPDTLIYEVKPGPYAALDDKDFAPWAPREGTPEVAAYLTRLEAALKQHLS
jgi:cupin fold WbuC family metalloprotein